MAARMERRESFHAASATPGKMVMSRSPSVSSFRKRRLAVLTSGGDAPGMNAAIRSVVRMALSRGAEVYAVYAGYQGLVNGDIRRMEWHDVAGILHHGGTEIFTARCPEFKLREGRLKAAHNLLKLGIDSLVVIGGDGSLTGANILQTEWPDLLKELVQKGVIKEELREKHPRLAITGLVGSIDNDMQGADYTIGANTALHRIISAVDALSTTASSHQRTFVVEVMGRNCGFLALMSALTTGADYVLIPEMPPMSDDWEAEMCSTLQAGRDMGRRCSIVIIAEGARDKNGNRITSEHVQKSIEATLKHETRITILGHVQRGGAPSVFDRNMSTLVGAAAAEHALSPDAEQNPSVIGWLGNKPTASPLMECVQRTQEVEKAISRKEFELAVEMRGPHFKAALELFHTFVKPRPEPERHTSDAFPKKRIAVMHVGAPSPGMNAAVRSAVRYALDHGHTMLGVTQGWKGLIAGDIKPLGWMDVNGWAVQGGCNLSTSRAHSGGDEEVKAVVANVLRYNVEAILVLGGYDAYESVLDLRQMARPRTGVTEEDWERFRKVPFVLVPCTISNNCPATEYSIGSDTALNNIMDAGDKIKQSSSAANRVFVVEVMGAYCGYLALMGALAVGAERAYLPEEGITLASLQKDTALLINRFSGRHRVGFLVCNEKASPVYTSQLLGEVLKEEARGTFDVRHTILGHLQQGGAPSPLDRMYATLMSAFAVKYLWEHTGSWESQGGGVAVGLIGDKLTATPLEFLPEMVDRKYRRPIHEWWLEAIPIFRLLAQSRPDEPAYDPSTVLAMPKLDQLRRWDDSIESIGHPPHRREDEEDDRYTRTSRRRHTSIAEEVGEVARTLAPLLVVAVPLLCVWLATRNRQ